MRWIAASLCCASCLSKPALPSNGTSCQTWSPWGTPRALDELNTPSNNEDGAWLSGNHLTLYYSSDATGEPLVYRATRSTATGTFDPGAIVDELGTTNNSSEMSPFLSDDERSIWLDSGGQIYTATRTSNDPVFSTPTIVGELSGTPSDFVGEPSLTSDLETIVYGFSIGGGQPATDLWIATRGGADLPFDPPAKLVAPSVDNQSDCCPSLSGSGDLLLFSSTRPNGVHRLWQSQRIGADYGNPTPLDIPGIPTESDEPFLTRDGAVLMFTVSASGGSDLWMVERTCMD